MELLARAVAECAQVVQGQGEELALPFAIESLFRRFRRGRLFADWLELHVSAPFLPVLGGVRVGGEPFHRHPEIGPERGLCGVEAREEFTLQRAGEEALRQILGVFVVLAEFEADEAIDRLPVQCGDALQGLVRQPGRGGIQQPTLGGRELVVRSADGCIGIQSRLSDTIIISARRGCS